MNNSEAYSPDWFGKQKSGAYTSAEIILPIVIDLVSPRSVVDVGSGVGAWLAYFREHGVVDVLGVDGEWIDDAQLLIPTGSFVRKDMVKPFSVGRTADLVLCLEVGEHLPEQSSEDLVRTLTETAPVVLFSAAIPKQGGTNHVNEQWPGYWADLFKKFGYIPVDAVRRRVWTNPNVEYWYAQNVIVYVKEGELKKYPKLEQEVKNGFSSALPLVHPRKYFYALQPPPPFWFRVKRKIRTVSKKLLRI